jgi:hypothetical protein
LKKVDSGRFKNLQAEGIYGKRYKVGEDEPNVGWARPTISTKIKALMTGRPGRLAYIFRLCCDPKKWSREVSLRRPRLERLCHLLTAIRYESNQPAGGGRGKIGGGSDAQEQSTDYYFAF